MFRYSKEVLRTPFKSEEPPKASTSKDVTSCTYKCEFCNKGWESESELYFHKKRHYKRIVKCAKKGVHFCWTCIRMFKTKEGLAGHYKKHHLLSSKASHRIEREIFACNECDNIFFNKDLLTIHVMCVHLNKEHRKKRKLVNCPLCTKMINVKYIWGHFHLHDVASAHTCRICLKKCSDWEELEKHLQDHPLYLNCDICNFTFSKRLEYKNHIEAHLSKKPEDFLNTESTLTGRYFIPKCRLSKRLKFGRLMPYSGLKLQDELMICILCREICTTIEEQQQHIMLHDSILENVEQNQQKEAPKLEVPRYACSCGDIFEHKILLKQHILRNMGTEISHKEMSVSDIEHLIGDKEDYAIIAIDFH